MSELTSMMNIDKEMAHKLTSVGIDSFEKLIEIGVEEAFLKLKQTSDFLRGNVIDGSKIL